MTTRAASGTTEWWWVRHAAVPGGASAIFGQQDVGCDTSDHAAIARLAAMLPADAVRIITPLRRTAETLAALCAGGYAGDRPPRVEPAFIEQHFGEWEGCGWTAMQASHPDAYAAFWQDPTRNAPPGGESFAAVMLRVAAAVERLSAELAGETIVCIAHGGSIRAAVGHALGLTPEAAMAIVIDNLSLTRLTRLPAAMLQEKGGLWRVEAVNIPCRWIPPRGTC
jgi:alpha-ribazole phosphatase